MRPVLLCSLVFTRFLVLALLTCVLRGSFLVFVLESGINNYCFNYQLFA